MPKNGYGAGIRFGIVDFDQTLKQFGKIQNSFFAVRNAANLADKAFQSLSKTFQFASTAGQFEEGLTAVGVVTRATSAELQLLRKTALRAAMATQFSPKEAVEGLKDLSTAGFTAQQSMKILTPVLDLAAGSLGQLGLSGAAKAVAGALNAFQLEAGKATIVTDKLLRITQLTNFQARDFGSSFGKAAAAMNKYGQSLDDTLIMTGLLRNLNLDASSASTAVRNAILRIGGDQKIQNMLMAKGIKLVDQHTKKMRPLLEIMQDLSVATRNMTTLQKQAFSKKVFGARGVFADAAVASAKYVKTLHDGRKVTLRGVEAIKALRQQMSTAAGTAKFFRDRMLSTFEGQKKLLTGIMQSIAVIVGKPLVTVFKPFVSFVVMMGNVLAKFLQSIPRPIKLAIAGFVTFTVAVSAATLGIIGLGVAAIGIMAILSALNVSLIGIATTATIIGGSIVALMAIVGGVAFAFHTNFSGVSDTLDTFKLLLKGTLAIAKQWKDGTATIPAALADSLENAGLLDMAIKIGGFFGRTGQFIQDLASAAGKYMPVVKEALEPFLKSVLSLGSAIYNLFSTIFTSLFGSVAISNLKGTKVAASTVEDTFMGILRVVHKVAKAVAVPLEYMARFIRYIAKPSMVAKFGNALSTALSTAWTIVKNVWIVVKAIGQAIGIIVVAAFHAVKDIVVSVWDVLKSVFSGVSGGTGKTITWRGVLEGVARIVVGIAKGIAGVLWFIGKVAKVAATVLSPVFWFLSATVSMIVKGWTLIFQGVSDLDKFLRQQLIKTLNIMRGLLNKVSFGFLGKKASVGLTTQENKSIVVSPTLGGMDTKRAPITGVPSQLAISQLPTMTSPGVPTGMSILAKVQDAGKTQAFTDATNAITASKEETNNLRRSMDQNTTAMNTLIRQLTNPQDMENTLIKAMISGMEQARVGRGGLL